MVRSIIVSSTREDAEVLLHAGPRRDFIELARAIGAELVYRPAGRKRTRVWGRIAGAHVSQAWKAARDARQGDEILADGEHIGIPLALFLALRGKRGGVRLVMLGHFVSKRWKLAAFRLASRVYARATVLVHSVRQRELIAPVLGAGWRVRTIPYHVDTRFWRRQCSGTHAGRLVLAVGSEARDYGTLIEAARGIDAEVVIAAGSHWARSVAGVRNQPSNIRYVSEVFSFAELRDLYERASLLVVPLQDVPNQSGVTAILEAMSMGLPVIVTATEGQRELVSGPIVGTAGQRSASATADRGPWLLRGSAPAEAARPNGLYVPPGDAHALTHAMRQLLEDDLEREAMGRVGRCCAEEFFETDNYVASLAAELTGDHQP